ncbi:PaaI family thioesterase [Flavivirga aquimarina]|uniref:Medium/long-chain acyl-CoA thioesterase YigI n=1 Tax=Flavivirga aquimarina TaxID=2027862 RepID=A0ABT8WEQ2_9FLAO|nr:PaaI family thioesterase [Flavivirga aquimarina]MDO5971639.1 PaaI family thioesterase [Flavivirga aquimarina]
MIEAIKQSYNKQGFMKTLGAELVSIKEGEVIITCHLNDTLTQQHGFFHAGVLTSIADVACGYAALSAMPKGSDVLTVEFKTNFIKAAKTDKIIAKGHVIKSGKTLTFCEGVVTNVEQNITYATMQATMICLRSNQQHK